MKTRSALIAGLLAVTLALVLAGCPDGNNTPPSPKSFKVTGINKEDIKATAEVNIISRDNSAPANGQVAAGEGTIVNQVVSVDLYPWTESGGTDTSQPWTGNGKWTIRLKLLGNDDIHYYDYFWNEGQKYNITDAITTLNFADFDLVHTGGE